MSWPFRHKSDYEGGTDENNCNTDDSLSEHDDFVKKLGQRTRV